jgi:hypothetical protein
MVVCHFSRVKLKYRLLNITYFISLFWLYFLFFFVSLSVSIEQKHKQQVNPSSGVTVFGKYPV